MPVFAEHPPRKEKQPYRYQHVCKDCDVRWRSWGKTSKCWSCGKRRKLETLTPGPGPGP